MQNVRNNFLCFHLLIYQLIFPSFVCAMPAPSIGRPRLFRTYKVSENQGYNCAIWQAARATSAAPLFFKSMLIGEKGSQEQFIDGGLGCNNPIAQIIQEAELVFGSSCPVACIVSIGTGHYDTIGLPTSDGLLSILSLNLVNVLKSLAVDCENVAEQFQKRYRNVANAYYRLNPEQGMQQILLSEWEKLGEVTTHTINYLENSVVTGKINSLVETLLRCPKTVTAAELSMSFFIL